MPTAEEKESASLVREAVDTAAEFFPRLIEALTRVSRDLQEDRLHEGMALFGTTQEGLKWFCNMMELRSVWLGAGSEETAMARGWPPFVDALAGAADALGSADYVLLSDLLLYEIVPYIGTALDVLRGLREEPVGHAV